MKLAAVGSNCVDLYLSGNEENAFPGGGPANMAVYAVRLGNRASYTGVVGDDVYGAMMLRKIQEKRVDTSHLHILEGNTAVSKVRLDGGERVFLGYDEGVLSSFTLSEEDLDFITSQDIVVSDLWGHSEEWFPRFKEEGMITAYDCATRPDDPAPAIAMPYTDYLFFSWDKSDPILEKKMRKYHEAGAGKVIAMLGEKGSLCFDGEEFHSFGIIPCPHLVDSMGAGDSYIAGFLSAISQGASLEEAMEKGAANATITLGYAGAW